MSLTEKRDYIVNDVDVCVTVTANPDSFKCVFSMNRSKLNARGGVGDTSTNLVKFIPKTTYKSNGNYNYLINGHQYQLDTSFGGGLRYTVWHDCNPKDLIKMELQAIDQGIDDALKARAHVKVELDHAFPEYP